MPMDKNGDLIFDVDEARELHNNAVRMLGRAIGIDVLTTFADVEVADMHSTSEQMQMIRVWIELNQLFMIRLVFLRCNLTLMAILLLKNLS